MNWRKGDSVLAEPRLIVAAGEMGRIELAQPGTPRPRLDLIPSTLSARASR